MNGIVSELTSLSEQLIQQGAERVPEELRKVFNPVGLIIYEWQDYKLEIPGAEKLQVGTEILKPFHGNIFLLNFKNQIGLTRIQPMDKGRYVSKPLFLEVISPKFNTPSKHIDFFTSLVEDIFQRVARLPFTYKAATSRNVVETIRPPTPLFTFHFLKHFGNDLLAALNTILDAPHRILIDEESLVPLGEASGVSPDSILNMMQRSSNWIKNSSHPVANRFRGYVPVRIIQHLPQETFDTPENRFILGFLKVIHLATDDLLRQSWWGLVKEYDKRFILGIRNLIQQSFNHTVFEDIGEQSFIPLNSQVLLRKEGYRQMTSLWQKFQQARRPLFEPLQRAIEVRNIAELYEFWAFFALVEKIGDHLKIPPILEFSTSDIHGLEWKSKVSFGYHGSIIYNQSFTRVYNQSFTRGGHYRTYSTPMRPDYSWELDGKVKVVFDAKFSFSSFEVMDEDTNERSIIERPSLNDLYKMHTYRDALGLDAAVILFPGNTPVFFETNRGKLLHFDIGECLSGAIKGIGAIPMQPGSTQEG